VLDLSEFGDAYDLEFRLGVDKLATSAIVQKDLQCEIIYHMSPHEDYTLASMLLCPEVIQALLDARFLEANECIEKVPRIADMSQKCSLNNMDVCGKYALKLRHEIKEQFIEVSINSECGRLRSRRYLSDEEWHGYINNNDRVLLKVIAAINFCNKVLDSPG
ncbi:hypothetical protein Tco_1277153, partial [Tanacetum coccineum]